MRRNINHNGTVQVTSTRKVGARGGASACPRKWRWHYRTLRALHGHLVSADLRERAKAAAPVAAQNTGASEMTAGDGNRDLALTLLSGERDAMRTVDGAIERILAGTYGVCLRTGCKIPLERLRAIPWTGFTKDAESELEQEGRDSLIEPAEPSSGSKLSHAG